MKKLILTGLFVSILLMSACSKKVEQVNNEETEEEKIFKEAYLALKENGVENFDMVTFINNDAISNDTKQSILFEAYKDRLPNRKYSNGVAVNRSTQERKPSLFFDGYYFDDYELFKNYIMSDFDSTIYEEYLLAQGITLTEYEEFVIEQNMSLSEALLKKQMEPSIAETSIDTIPSQETNVLQTNPTTVSIELGTYLSENRQIVVYGNDNGVIDIALADSFDDKNLDLRSIIIKEAYINSDNSISITKTTLSAEQLTIYPAGTGFKLNDEIFYRVANSQSYTKLGFDYINYHNTNFVDNWYYDFSEVYKGIITYTFDFGDENMTDEVRIYTVLQVEEELDENGHNYALKYTASSNEEIEEFTVYFGEAEFIY